MNRKHISSEDIDALGPCCFALAVGCFVGCIWWYLHHKYFVDLYWYLVPHVKANGLDPKGFDGLYAAMDIVTVAWQSFTVSFTTALFAPRRPYLLATTAIVLTFACKIPHDFLIWTWDVKGSPHASQPAWVIWLCLIIYMAGPFMGAGAARMFKLFIKPTLEDTFVKVSEPRRL